jgi:hypothetical protein
MSNIKMNSILDIINIADNFPVHPESTYPTYSPDGAERYVPFHLTLADFESDIVPMGLLRPQILFELQKSGIEFLLFHKMACTDEVIYVTFANHALERGGLEMGRLLQEVAMKWKEEGKFQTQLRGKCYQS